MDEEESFFNLVTQFQSKRMDDQRCSLAIIDNKENQQASTLPSNIHGEYIYPGNGEGKVRSPGVTHSLVRFPDVSLPSFLLLFSFSSYFVRLLFLTESPSRLKEDLMDLIAGMQSRRMDEQRASLPRLPGLNNANPDILRRLSVEPAGEDAAALPDENFFEMLMRCQVRYLPPFDQISTSTILSNVIILCILISLKIVLGHKTGRSAQRLAGHIASETQGANLDRRRFFFVDYAIAIGSTRRSESRGSFTSHRCQRSCCHILLERQNGFSITNPNVSPPSPTALIHDRNVC
jgi:hypothetical protein